MGILATASLDDIQAIKLIVDTIGFNADPTVRSSQEIAVATAPIDSPMGPIQPGQVAGRRFHLEAVAGGEVVVRVTVNWLMGQENLDPAWTFGPAGQRYEMEVRGNPDFSVVIKGFQSEVGGEDAASDRGVIATAAHCLNSIPAVCGRAGHRHLSGPAADQRSGGAVAAVIRPPSGAVVKRRKRCRRRGWLVSAV